MQLPLLPLNGHVHWSPGPQTIGLGGAASSMVAQSESTLHGYCAFTQMPHPADWPPGALHS
jgi:hypothetical protein